MGSKIEARKTMKEAGVPIIEGINTSLNNEEEAAMAGREIGYPLMLKASAGGGGIGMQLVNSEEELLKAFAGNQKTSGVLLWRWGDVLRKIYCRTASY